MTLTPSTHGRPRPTRAARAITAVRTDHRHPVRSVGLIQTDAPAPHGESTGSVHDYARRMAFLTELDSATWMSRYSAAERLGDPGAVHSITGYSAWLRRVSTAWAAVPMPTAAQTQGIWPFTCLPPAALESAAHLDADLREMALASGGPRRSAPRPPAVVALVAGEEIDAAYVAGAAYVAVSTAQEVAVLSADVDHLSQTASRTPLPRHYVQHSLQVATCRNPLRRALADWADAAGPRAAERVVLTARMLMENLSTALVASTRPGW